MTFIKIKHSIPLLTGLFLLVLAGSLQAGDTSHITAKVSPANSGAKVTGEGVYTNGTIATLTVSDVDDCFVFTNWTVAGKQVSTNNPYEFTVTKNEALTANYVQSEYTIATSSSPTNWGTTSGGGKKGCGTTVTLTATAKPGFAFTEWASIFGPTSTNKSYKFTVSGPDDFVAYFKDIEKPTVVVTNIRANDEIATASLTIEGTAKDNVGVQAVYYNLNGAGWVPATTMNDFALWYAFVTLIPDSLNTVSAYAVDTSGNISKTNTVKFDCTAVGLAPLSIAGQSAVVGEGTNAIDTNYVSFDSAIYVRWSQYTNNGSEVGTYTYTPTGPNTAELKPLRILPTRDTGSNNSTLELTFTDAYDATFTNLSGGSGTVNFYLTEESVPPALNGVVAVETSYYNSDKSTNDFESASFTSVNQGGTLGGTYTFTPFTQVDALLVQTYTNPPSFSGTTNYQILMFDEGTVPATGYYASTLLDSSGVVNLDAGTFTTTSSNLTTTYWGPATLAGLQATITPEGEKQSFIRSYGKGTFASTSVIPTEPTDVGIYLADLHVTTDTGISTLTALAPPYAVGVDDATVVLTWNNILGTSATISNMDTGTTSTAKYSKPNFIVPPGLSGLTIKTTTKGGKPGTFAFNFNNYTSTGAIESSGTYTYALYTPTMALVVFTTPSVSVAGPSLYVHLNYTSATAGTYVSARPDSGVTGGYEFSTGGFSVTK
jgi:Divergent InlB B-repeat domain